MLKIEPSSQFKKDFKRFRYNKEVINELDRVLYLLQKEEELPAKYQDHPLKGNQKDYRDCHVKPDVILIYRIKSDTLYLERLGSHSTFFN